MNIVGWYGLSSNTGVENFLASSRTRFPWRRSFTVALEILACNMFNLHEMSGLVLVAANCKLPINPRKLWSSSFVIGLVPSRLRSRGTWIVGMS